MTFHYIRVTDTTATAPVTIVCFGVLTTTLTVTIAFTLVWLLGAPDQNGTVPPTPAILINNGAAGGFATLPQEWYQTSMTVVTQAYANYVIGPQQLSSLLSDVCVMVFHLFLQILMEAKPVGFEPLESSGTYP